MHLGVHSLASVPRRVILDKVKKDCLIISGVTRIKKWPIVVCPSTVKTLMCLLDQLS